MPILSTLRGALLALLALVLGLQDRAWAEPALWKVQGPHATVWLFGSIHVLKPDLKWRSARIDSALRSADVLWLEIDNADDPSALAPLVLQYGLDPAHPLATRLSVADMASLDQLLEGYGVPTAQIQPMRPWVIGLMLDVLPLTKAGYDPNASVEHVLSSAMRGAGKPVMGFETAESQVKLLADLNPDEEIAFLKSSMDDAAKGPEEIESLVAAWNAGDVATIARLETKDMRANYPTLYKRLIVERNARFAAQIAQLAQGQGVVFAAVGAGHLAGEGSVQDDLARLGLKAERQ